MYVKRLAYIAAAISSWRFNARQYLLVHKLVSSST